MSGNSSAEKTEDPTPKRLRDLRKKGQVATSKEVVSTALIVMLIGYFSFSWNDLFDSVSEMALAPARFYEQPFEEAFRSVMDLLILQFVRIVAPLVLMIVVVAFLANVLQKGIVFSVEPIKPSPKKIHPVEGFKKIFSRNNFVEFLKSILKVLTISGCTYVVVSNHIGTVVDSHACSLSCVFATFVRMMIELVTYCVGVFIVVAVADLGFQRYDFTKKNRMTKDEVKRDHKESDGDPVIKGRRRQLQRQIASGQEMEGVKRSSVVVKNPEHYAVAIRYDAKEAPLPYVTAKGENLVALQIVRVAEENGIPVMENVPLARGLYSASPNNAFIPIDFIPAVVEALHWVKDNYPNFRQSE